MANFRTDQFDNIPQNIDRVGAHRGPKVRGRGWIGFVIAILACAVLIVGGLYVLSLLNPALKVGFGSSVPQETDTPTGTPTPVITPITDPSLVKSRKITITVLNGTDVVGAQITAGKVLKGDGWNVTSEANASESTIKTTTVYYSSATNEDVAEGIQSQLGTGTIAFSNAFPGAPITVVIGSDYTG